MCMVAKFVCRWELDGDKGAPAEPAEEGDELGVGAQRRVGDAVNLEVDVLARYIERLLAGGAGSNAGLSFESLRNMGY